MCVTRVEKKKEKKEVTQMHAFRKLRARIFRIRKTRVYDTARSVCTKALGAFRKKEKKKKREEEEGHWR